MIKEVKDEWVKDLRSGRYKQTTGALQVKVAFINEKEKIVTGYCCLGVLCEQLVRRELLQNSLPGVYTPVVNSQYEHELDGELTEKILDFLNLPLNEQTKLVGMNDGNNDTRRHSFNEIADYIEQNIESDDVPFDLKNWKSDDSHDAD